MKQQDATARKGAVVGKHLVTFGTLSEAEYAELKVTPPDAALNEAIAANRADPKKVDVPAAGLKDLTLELGK